VKIPEIIVIETIHRPGSLASVLSVIANHGLIIEHLQSIKREQGRTTWEITLEMDDANDQELYNKIDALPAAKFIGKSDRVFNRHRGGKIKTVPKMPINTLQVLRDVYTPGVARVCLAIQAQPELAFEYTSLGDTVAIITNGTAILGLGDIGPLAGLPVMEGKAALFASLAGLNGVPILMDEKDPQKVVSAILAIEKSFGAIQLEDFAAPGCFEIEQALRARLNKPVLHDDQHGTAVVALAALHSATRRVGRSLESAVVGQIGLGAAGLGIVRLLMAHGAKRIIGTDRQPAACERLRQMGGDAVDLQTLMKQADIVVATTGVKGLIKSEWIREGQVILALSNPDPEIEPVTAIECGAAFAADGKGINNVLAFPGLFRGALDARATRFTDAMLMAAAHALAESAPVDNLVPDALDPKVHEKVAQAVRAAALKDS
jgi:malate dehydrogenase (oxaloacetate-decarboxylating)